MLLDEVRRFIEIQTIFKADLTYGQIKAVIADLVQRTAGEGPTPMDTRSLETSGSGTGNDEQAALWQDQAWPAEQQDWWSIDSFGKGATGAGVGKGGKGKGSESRGKGRRREIATAVGRRGTLQGTAGGFRSTRATAVELPLVRSAVPQTGAGTPRKTM